MPPVAPCTCAAHACAADLPAVCHVPQWVPYEIAGSSWEQEEEQYVKHLLSICDRFAPGEQLLAAYARSCLAL